MLHIDRASVQKIPVPGGNFVESDKDRIISNSLTGKVVIDESDEDKAIRLIESNMAMLKEQLSLLLKDKK